MPLARFKIQPAPQLSTEQLVRKYITALAEELKKDLTKEVGSLVDDKINALRLELKKEIQTEPVTEVLKKITSVKGDQGEKGDKPTPLEVERIVKGVVDSIRTQLKGKKGDKGDKGDKGNDGETPTKKEVEQVVRSIFKELEGVLKGDKPTPEEIKEIATEIILGNSFMFKGEKGDDGTDGSPDTAQQIKEKLETLKDEKRLDASAIKNLPDIKFLQRELKNIRPLVKGASEAVRFDDLSSSLDGSTKAFTVTNHSKPLFCTSQQSPTFMIETTHFTISTASSGVQTLTFTNEVEPIFAGQKLYFYYII